MNINQSFKKFAKGADEKIDMNREVWSYTRVSSKDQFANKSLENQKEKAFDYARKEGYEITETFGGTYESASGDFTRREFMKLIEKVRKAKRKPFAILIYKMSRFSRTGGSAIALAFELIDHHKVNLIETTTGKNTFTEVGELDLYSSLIEARRETLNKLDMTIPGMRKFLEAGNWLAMYP